MRVNDLLLAFPESENINSHSSFFYSLFLILFT